jgi:hypothetical protein
MMNFLSARPILVACALVLCTLCAGVRAQSLGPLRVVLPVGTGPGVDTITRAAQNELSKALGGQAVVMKNLPGAGGFTGTTAIVKAAPDGNPIGVVSNNHAVSPSVFKSRSVCVGQGQGSHGQAGERDRADVTRLGAAVLQDRAGALRGPGQEVRHQARLSRRRRAAPAEGEPHGDLRPS